MQCTKKDKTKKIATENKCCENAVKIEGNASGMRNMEMTGCVLLLLHTRINNSEGMCGLGHYDL